MFFHLNRSYSILSNHLPYFFFRRPMSLFLETQEPKMVHQRKLLEWFFQGIQGEQNFVCCMENFTYFKRIFQYCMAMFICDRNVFSKILHIAGYILDFPMQHPQFYNIFSKNLCMHSCKTKFSSSLDWGNESLSAFPSEKMLSKNSESTKMFLAPKMN